MSKIGALALELCEQEEAEFWPTSAAKPAKSAAVLLREKCKAKVRFHAQNSRANQPRATAVLAAELNFSN